jgi:cytochrome c5
MKREISRVWGALAIATVSCALLYAQSQTGEYSQANLGRVRQPAPRSQQLGATYIVEAYGLHRPQLAPGKDRELVEAYCNTCHSLMYITMQPPLPAATWEAEVKKMVETLGQPIPQDAIPRIIAYLQKHYTPETRKAETVATPKSGATRRPAKKAPVPKGR